MPGSSSSRSRRCSNGRGTIWNRTLPDFAWRGRLSVNTHIGFWKSMDTSKDQQELERLCAGRQPPWIHTPIRNREGA